MRKDNRLQKLETAVLSTAELERFTIYLVGADGTRVKAHPETEQEQAVYSQWVAAGKARADEITRQDLI